MHISPAQAVPVHTSQFLFRIWICLNTCSKSNVRKKIFKLYWLLLGRVAQYFWNAKTFWANESKMISLKHPFRGLLIVFNWLLHHAFGSALVLSHSRFRLYKAFHYLKRFFFLWATKYLNTKRINQFKYCKAQDCTLAGVWLHEG